VGVGVGAVSLTAAGVCGIFLFSFEGAKAIFFLLGCILVAAVFFELLLISSSSKCSAAGVCLCVCLSLSVFL
jgi:hypothetical protein